MYTETGTSETQQNIFNEEDLLDYRDASVGQRFLNFLIDALLMQYTLAFVSAWLLIKFLLAVSPETAYQLFSETRDTGNMLLASYLIAIVNYIVYYTFCERYFKGYTLGKLITGTRAVKGNGQELSFKDAILRSLSRIVPFEVFSIFFDGQPWHDRWTKTRVVKTR